MSKKNGKNPALAWQTEPDVLELSRGPVEVRKPDVATLVMEDDTGSVPTTLRAGMVNSLKGKKQKTGFEIDPKDLGSISKFMKLLIKATVVSFTVVDENPDYENGQIAYGNLTMDDRMAIFDYAMEEMVPAEKFPAESGEQG